jgi:hypothetical protein
MVGYVYNITNDFTTTADFIEGAGKKYKAGTNVVIVDATTIAYNEVTPVGTENPSEEGWYELVEGNYVLSEDATVDSEKTYYEKVETPNFMFDVLGNFIDVDEIEDKIEAVAGMIAGFFEDTADYFAGEVVIYEDNLYRFKVDHASVHGWDPEEVEEVTVIDLIMAAEPDSLTPEQVNNLIALLG